MGDKFDFLLNRLFVSNLSNLDERWELKVLPCHLFDQGLHRGREHKECLVVSLTTAHLLFLLLGCHFIVTFMQIIWDLINNRINRVLQVVVNHLVSLIKNDEIALV